MYEQSGCKVETKWVPRLTYCIMGTILWASPENKRKIDLFACLSFYFVWDSTWPRAITCWFLYLQCTNSTWNIEVFKKWLLENKNYEKQVVQRSVLIIILWKQTNAITNSSLNYQEFTVNNNMAETESLKKSHSWSLSRSYRLELVHKH